MSHEYHFITHWRFNATISELFEILADPLTLTEWWPSVYLGVKELDPGDENHVGRVIDLYTKGWLPYTLLWQFTVDEIIPNERLSLTARGDFAGVGVWTFEPEDEWVNVTYDWRIQATKPLLRYLSPIMRPIFSANHIWAMEQGETSLQLELERRRALTPEARQKIAPPPPPISNTPFIFVGLLFILAALYFFFR